MHRHIRHTAIAAVAAASGILVTLAALAQPAPSAPPIPSPPTSMIADPASGRLASTVFEWTLLTAKPTRVGERRDLFDRATATLDRLECHVTTLNPGEIAHPAHRHPDEELIFVKEGTLDVTINDTTRSATAGSVLFFASNDLHGLRNSGGTRASYYVLRWTSPGLEGPNPPAAP